MFKNRVSLRKIVNLTPEKGPDFLGVSKKYLFIFFILGQSSFNPHSNTDKKSFFFKFLHFLPSVLFILLTYATGVTCFYGFRMTDMSVDKVIYAIIIITRLVTCTILMQRTPFFDTQMKVLITKLVKMEYFASHGLRFQLSYIVFDRNYCQKVRIILASYVTLVCAKFLTRVSDINYVRQISALFLLLTTTLAILHILFYVYLMKCVIAQISRNVVNMFHRKIVQIQEFKEWKNLISVENFRNFKQAHFKLWELTDLVNDQFGWILVTLVLQNMINTIQPVYWIVVELHKDDLSSNLRVISNYIYTIF